jgi:hypothetical protein
MSADRDGDERRKCRERRARKKMRYQLFEKMAATTEEREIVAAAAHGFSFF